MIIIKNEVAHIGNAVKEILAESNLSARIDTAMHVVLKPNLVVSQPASKGATTHPEIAQAVTEYLIDYGCREITIAESSWCGDDTKRAFNVCGYQEIARRYNVALSDLKDDETKKITYDGLELEICRIPLECDFLINLPLVKGHSQTRLTCALKNMKGCIPDREKRRYHSLGLHRPIAALNAVLKQHFILADAVCADQSFETGGNPSKMNALLAGYDPVALDCAAAKMLGIAVRDVPYIGMSASYGVGRLYEEDGDVASRITRIDAIKQRIREKSACSACLGNLIAAIDETGIDADALPVLYIGQGYKGCNSPGCGVGNCACGFEKTIPGCPPGKDAIKRYLLSL